MFDIFFPREGFLKLPELPKKYRMMYPLNGEIAKKVAPYLQSSYFPPLILSNNQYFSLEGESTLEDYINNKANKQIPRTAFFYQIVFSVYYIHLLGIVHCDIKPNNIIIYKNTNEPDARLIDFDCSYIFKTTNPNDPKELSSNFEVNINYVNQPPESIEYNFNQFLLNRIDIFQLGLIIYFLETSKLPYSSSKVNYMKLNDILPEFPVTTSQDVIDMVSFLTHCDPLRRPSMNLLMVILHEKLFSFKGAQQTTIPQYKKSNSDDMLDDVIEDYSKTRKGEPNKRIYYDTIKTNQFLNPFDIMEYNEIEDFCTEFFPKHRYPNQTLFFFNSQRDVFAFLNAKIKEQENFLTSKNVDVNIPIEASYLMQDKEIRVSLRKLRLIREIRQFIPTEPVVASLYFQECFQKTFKRAVSTTITESYFIELNRKDSDDNVFTEKISKGPIAIDYFDFLCSTMDRIKSGYIPSDSETLNTILKISDETEDGVSQLRFLFGEVSRKKSLDFTAAFAEILSHSPLTSMPSKLISEDLILQYYSIQYEKDCVLTESSPEWRRSDNYIREPRSVPIYGLYPTLNVIEAPPFFHIANDKEDIIYYCNKMLTDYYQETQSSNYVIFRTMYLFKALYKGKYVKKDEVLASEFGRLIPKKSFFISSRFIIHFLYYYFDHLLFSKTIAYDPREIQVVASMFSEDGSRKDHRFGIAKELNEMTTEKNNRTYIVSLIQELFRYLPD